jgi:ABC-type nitrate/sulfonate/bicarbonate transport system substrate-binding protein
MTLRSLLLLSTLSLAVLSAAGAADTKPLTVRLGLDTAAGGSYEFRTAKDQGFFAKRGIEATAFNFAFGIDTVNALLVDRVDTALAADYALANSLGRGDFVVVSTLSHTTEQTKGNTVLFVRKGITKPSDLIGKKLGVARGTVLEYIWAKYLEKNHIEASQITWVPYTSPDEAAVGIQRGDIDAVWQLGALVDKFAAFPNLVRFGDLGDSGTLTVGYLLFQRAFVKAHPEAVGQILLAIQEGAAYVKAHPAETGALAFKELKLPAENVAKDIARNDYSLGFTQGDFDHLADIKAWLEAKKILKANYELKDKVVLDPLRAVLPQTVTYVPRG